mmetsp:Transcript_31346/g.50808  ORF Transcript_31346/g.50808 Transcript_31346/m.50808 type:complete len:251 (+) Transcript_31346:3-755(+)
MAAQKMIGFILTLLIATLAESFYFSFGSEVPPFSYQTMTGGVLSEGSVVKFDITFERYVDTTHDNLFIEAILTPDTNISHIGYIEGHNLHLCCNVETYGMYGCNAAAWGTLIIPDPRPGLFRQKVFFNDSRISNFIFETPVSEDGVYAFAVATCNPYLQLVDGAANSITTVRGHIDVEQNEVIEYSTTDFEETQAKKLIIDPEKIPFLMLGITVILFVGVCCCGLYCWYCKTKSNIQKKKTEREPVLLQV